MWEFHDHDHHSFNIVVMSSTFPWGIRKQQQACLHGSVDIFFHLVMEKKRAGL